MVFDLVLKNGSVFTETLEEKDVGINTGRIAGIGKGLQGKTVIDCKGKVVLPGVIDPHVHFRCPGMDYKEEWSTGSRAAAHGGVTTVMDMPNTSPPLTTVQGLEEKNKLVAGESLVNYGFHFGAALDNIAELEKVSGVASVKVFMGSSTGNLLVDKEEALRKVFKAAKEKRLVVAVHAEDEELVKQNTVKAKEQGIDDPVYHSLIRSNECAEKAVAKALELSREIGNKLYVCHASTRQEMALIREAKQEGQEVYTEVTPHHLFLTNKNVKDLGNYGKMNPPLRSFLDQKALWDAIKQGAVDVIGTDHAPHLREEKDKPFWEAPSGVPGIETMVPLLLDAVNKGRLSLQKMTLITSGNPARVYGLEGKGRVFVGGDADLTVIDLDREETIRGKDLYTKCGWSPFEGRRLKGVVEKTIINGRVVYDRARKRFSGQGINVFGRGKGWNSIRKTL